MIFKKVWIDNLPLLNHFVKLSGGVMTIESSYTDCEGDILCSVTLSKSLLPALDKRYKKEKVRK